MLIRPIVPDAAKEILQEAGILAKRSSTPVDGNKLRDLLELNNLSLEETISELSMLARGSQDESIRYRSIETSLKLHGAMKQDDKVDNTPQIVINIMPLSASQNDDPIPSILIPREAYS